MDNTEVLTIEQIDSRLADIPTRLKELDEQIKVKTDELGKSRIRGLLTPPIHKSIRALEDERRELSAELEFLTLERERIQNAITQKAAEDAAAEYQDLREQLEPLAIEIIKDLCNTQSRLIEHERIEMLMEGKAGTAGKLVNTALGGVIKLQTGQIGRHIDQALLSIKSSNQENLQKVGIEIPDLYQEREKMLGIRAFAVNESGPSESNINQPAQPEAGSFESGLLKGARLGPEQPKASGFDAAVRRGASLSE